MFTTTKGKQSYISDDYIYIAHKTNVKKTKQYWRCIKYSQQCGGRAVSDYGSTELQVTRKHNHLADYAEIEVRQKIAAMKERAAKSDVKEPPKNLVNECFEGLSEEAKKLMPSIDALRRAILRSARKATT